MSADIWWARAQTGTSGPPPPPPPPPSGPIMSALDLHAGYGADAHPTFTSSVYAHSLSNIDNWAAKIAALGATHVRAEYGGSFSSAGVFTPHAGTTRLAQACRANGLMWVMLAMPEASCLPTSFTPEQTRKVVDHIAANNADVCLALEGVNEPQSNRGDACKSDVPADWVTSSTYGVAAHQKALFVGRNAHAELAHVKLLGSPMQAPHADASYTGATNPIGGKKHWHQCAAAGMGDWVDYWALHTYPGGFPPMDGTMARVGHIRDAFGQDMKIWVTEWGYHNGLNVAVNKHRPASRAASGTYGPRALLQMIEGQRFTLDRYETLDDYDPGLVNNECNFGLWAVGQASVADSEDPSTWSPKSEVTKIKAMFAAIGDPAGTLPYTTVAYPSLTVALGGHNDVKWHLIQNAAGQTYILMYRDQSVWDPINRVAITVGAVSITVTDATGARTVSVDADVSWLLLR